MCKVNCKLQPIDSDSCFPLKHISRMSSPVFSYREWLQSMHSPKHPQTASKLQVQNWYKQGWAWVQLFLPIHHPNALVNSLVGLKSNNSQETEKWKMTARWWRAGPCCFTQCSIDIEPWCPFSGCDIPKQYLSLLNPKIYDLMSFKSSSEEVNRRKMHLKG